MLTLLLGPEKAAEAIAQCELEEPEVEKLAAEVARLKGVDAEVRRAVREEFARLAAAGDAEVEGLAAAQELLSRALGVQKAEQILTRVRGRKSARPFAPLAPMDANRLLEVLRDEQPQAIAVVLRHLQRRKAGEVLSGLPEEVRMEVVMRVAKGGEPSGDALRQMESALTEKAAALGTDETQEEKEGTAASGPRALVEILNQADLGVENAVLEALGERDPELGEQVRESMFVFDDLPRLDARALQIVLRQVEATDLAMALKGASDEIKKVVFENVSENAAQGLRDDLEALGPVRRRDVYAAQQKVVMQIRALADEGKIMIRQEEEDEEEDLIT